MKIKALLKSRKAKRGSLAVVITIIFIAIIVLLNFAAQLLTARFPGLQFDMTSAGSYELQNDTVSYLSQLDSDVNIYVLSGEKKFKDGLNAYQGAQYFVQADKLLKKMGAMDHVTMKYVDLSKNPTFTNKYKDIDWNDSSILNLVLVESGKNYTALTLDECFSYDSETLSYYGYYVYTENKIEQAVITGVLDVTSGEKVGVEFLTGAGENEDGYSALKTLLKQNAYDVKETNVNTGKLSADSSIAVIYAPAVDLSETAVQKIEKWLDTDGEHDKTLVYIPIDIDADTPNIDALLKEYGMKLSDGLVFCTSPDRYINNNYTFLVDYANTDYAADLKNSRVNVITHYTRNVEIEDDSKASALLNATSSVGVIPFDVDTSEFTSDKDIEKYYIADGINAAALGTRSNTADTSSHVAVFGSPYMFTQDALSATSFNNANYIVNFCNTVTDRGDMGITINSASLDSEELGITNAATVYAMGVVFIAIVPLAVLIIGLVLYIRRRNK